MICYVIRYVRSKMDCSLFSNTITQLTILIFICDQWSITLLLRCFSLPVLLKVAGNSSHMAGVFHDSYTDCPFCAYATKTGNHTSPGIFEKKQSFVYQESTLCLKLCVIISKSMLWELFRKKVKFNNIWKQRE